MTKKGKGRQSGGFGSKQQRVAYNLEWQQQVHEVRKNKSQSNPGKQQQQQQQHRERPKLASLGQLRGLLRERKFQESYELLQRRRRLGFVPFNSAHDLSTSSSLWSTNQKNIQETTTNPPGWILNYGKLRCTRDTDVSSSSSTIPNQQPFTSSSSSTTRKIESLQDQSLKVFGEYILEYMDAMGREQLRQAVSLLPSATLTVLSIAISQKFGMTDDLACVIGKHAHVEELCLGGGRSETTMEASLTDQGLLELVPRLPSNHSCSNSRTTLGSDRDPLEDGSDDVGDWEEIYDTENHAWNQNVSHTSPLLDVLQLDGCNVRLKRLELSDCPLLSSQSVLALLEKCAWITHLSLAGSIQSSDDGVQVVQALPDLLPSLQVLDVTRCGWFTPDILHHVLQGYNHKRRETTSQKPPIIYCQESDWFDHHHHPYHPDPTRAPSNDWSVLG